MGQQGFLSHNLAVCWFVLSSLQPIPGPFLLSAWEFLDQTRWEVLGGMGLPLNDCGGSYSD